jgi:hypothetical protein
MAVVVGSRIQAMPTTKRNALVLSVLVTALIAFVAVVPGQSTTAPTTQSVGAGETVPKEKYDALKLKCDRLSEQLAVAQTQVQQAQAEVAAIKQELKKSMADHP